MATGDKLVNLDALKAVAPVSYAGSQTLTAAEQAQARGNIGADAIGRYDIARPISGGYSIVKGYFTGNAGENVGFTSSGTAYARTSARYPVYYKARIGLTDYTTYEMRVFVVSRSGEAKEILWKTNLVAADVYVDPSIDEVGISVAINFHRRDSAAMTAADYTAIAGLFGIWYGETDYMRGQIYTARTVRMPLELGGLSTPNYRLYDQESDYSNFYTRMRTPHFLDLRLCRKLTVTSSFHSISAVYYDSAYAFLSTASVTTGVETEVPIGAQFARFVVANEADAAFDHATGVLDVSCVGEAKLLKATDNQGNSAAMIMCYAVPGQLGRQTSAAAGQIPVLADTTGLLKLPPNYSNEGAPVPLIVYCHGSADYKEKWQNSIRKVGHPEVITYLVNEGFAVFDSFGHSSAAPYTDGVAHTYGSVDCQNCYVAGIRRVLDVYNIRQDGVYVTGISSGGIPALNLAFNNTIPVLACGPFAPAMSPYARYCGYNEEQRREYAWAMGFEGDASVLVGRNGESPTVNQSQPAHTDALFNYFRANAERVCGYSPMWNGVTNVAFDTLVGWSLEVYTDTGDTRLGGGDRDATNWVNVTRICKTPVKIWVADDDDSVPPEMVYNFLKSLRNGGCIGELRQVPNGQGGHDAYTKSETTTRASGVTALGIAYTDIPIYWMELVAFFRSF